MEMDSPYLKPQRPGALARPLLLREHGLKTCRVVRGHQLRSRCVEQAPVRPGTPGKEVLRRGSYDVETREQGSGNAVSLASFAAGGAARPLGKPTPEPNVRLSEAWRWRQSPGGVP